MKRISVVALALFMATACSSVSSADVKTSGLYADMVTVADGDGRSYTETFLRVGGAGSTTFVTLSDGDVLATTLGSQTLIMEEQSLVDLFVYRADFSGDAADEDYIVSFERRNDDSAPYSVMSLPQPFTVDELNISYSRENDDLILTWDNQQDEKMRIWVEGTCITDQQLNNETDAQSYTFAAGSIKASNSDPDAVCDIEVTLWRSREGEVDTAFGEGGDAWGHQRRKLTIVSAP